ncbi:MAG: RnfABCDGE type electron transport complex subunit D [Gammaproteobacteria bacterium]
MKPKKSGLILQPAPWLRSSPTTPAAMRQVIYALVPLVISAVWWFGLSALLVLLAAVTGSLMTEWLFTQGPDRGQSLHDLSAALTGLLLGLSLPPGLPLWMAFLGGAASIGLGKLIWGGLGQNPFNPALVGRAFLLAAFPAAMTTWHPPKGPDSFFDVIPSNLALPLAQPTFDALSAATPLGLMKFQHQATPLSELMFGNTAGCFGETNGVLILLAGLYLVWQHSIDWRIPVAVLASATALAALLHLADAHRAPPLVALFSGGLLFGAVFMATDPVTSPLSPKGAWLFGTGIGLLAILIRAYGGYPEGIMYAILLMNGATPLIERATQPRPFGR